MPWAERLGVRGSLDTPALEVGAAATAPTLHDPPRLPPTDDADRLRRDEWRRHREAFGAVPLPVERAGVAAPGDDLRRGAPAVGAHRRRGRVLPPRPAPLFLAPATDRLHVEPVGGVVAPAVVVLPRRGTTVGTRQRADVREPPAHNRRANPGAGASLGALVWFHARQDITLAVVACALQDALRRLAALEGQSGPSGQQPAS
jgi:hypothetical protein